MKSVVLLLALSVLATGACTEVAELNWSDNSDNEQGFEVERKTADSEFVLLATVGENQTQYFDDTAEQGIEYFYRVRAYNAFGVSGYTNEATFLAINEKYLTPFTDEMNPTGLGVQQVLSANITINVENITVNQK